jgi:DNA ligase 1
MVEGIAEASGCAPHEVRRAVAVSGDLASVAATALQSGPHGLSGFRMELGRPVHAMLAQTAADVESAVAALGRAVLDFKMDGARVQVHKHGADVAVFSRRLHDVSASVPEIVEAVATLPSQRLVLDGEALDAHAHPLPFQTTMRRFGRTQDVERMRRMLPLSVLFFDCLHADGEDLLDAPTEARLTALDTTVREDSVMPRIVTSDAAAATAFLARALQAGHEGVMAKDPAAPYEAGTVPGSRSSRRTRSIWSCSPPSGAAAVAGLVEQPASGCAGRDQRGVRHARQDLQGPDRRDAGLADAGAARARDRSR